uniref:Galactose mutarotase N-terminal barrel domain-containing protein n=1 Tax=Panagrolaimus sp. PS1159 TaxID=55785 RepID=A0AC35EZV9_9BILA
MLVPYRPPIGTNDSPNLQSTEKLTVKSTNSTIFSFTVSRNSDGEKLWDTSLGGLLFADQYIQISTLLSTNQIFGFGENVHKTLMHDLSKYRTWGMFSRDAGPDSVGDTTHNYYGVHPFYMGLNSNGKTYGVFILNSNAQEVTLGPAPHLTYRTIGGQLEFFFFPGPTPSEVIAQYQQVIGKPFLPPYWALGFQICRWGYTGVAEIKSVVDRTKAAGIPQDVQFSDIDYMNRYQDFTYNKDSPAWSGLPAFIDTLHKNYGMHFTLIFDPAVEADYDSFKRGIAANASFIEWPRMDLVPTGIEDSYPYVKGTKIMLGKVWPANNAAFPDFLDPQNETQQWWESELEGFVKEVGFDGAWIDMNEPSNFDTQPNNGTKQLKYNVGDLTCPIVGADSYYDKAPYETVGVFNWGDNTYLFTDTLCMFASTMRNTSVFYNTKNLYGWSEARATMKGMNLARGNRSVVISRSTFASSGQFGGHWLGDNTARWADLQTSIIGAQEFNLFGIPYVGSDICGFNGPTNEELCLRWHQMGAFHSFSRNHNSINQPAQDPAQWPSVAAAARKALLFRYRYLPYLYSLHFLASINGGTVVRPIFFEFPLDPITPTLSHQFLWGSALMIIPVTAAGVTEFQGYLPPNATWYSVYDSYYGSNTMTGFTTMYAPTTSLIPLFVRGGYIIPRQAPAQTTVFARKNRFEILIAFDSKTLSAAGELYWDDGDSLFTDISSHNYHHFNFNATVSSKSTIITITKDKTATGISLPALENIEIFGHPWIPAFKNATLNGSPVSIDMSQTTYFPFTYVANITTTGLINLNNGQSWILQWPNTLK